MFDESAIRYFRQTHGPVLLSYVLGLIGNDAGSAREIVDETMRRARADPEAGAGGDRWNRAWLFAEAKRIVAEGDAGPADGPSDRGEAAARKALAMLPAAAVMVLIEVAWKGRAVPEVAAALGISTDAASAYLAEAVRALRPATGPGGDLPEGGATAGGRGISPP